MKLFGSKKNKSSRGASYYKRENIVHTLEDLKQVYTPKNKILHKTEEVIMYNNMILSEISEKVLRNAIGEAHYIIKNLENINNYKILFYRHSVDDFNYLMQFHFCENTFLFVNNMVRSSYLLGNREKKSILAEYRRNIILILILILQMVLNYKSMMLKAIFCIQPIA